MINYIITGVIIFLCGFILAFIIYKNKTTQNTLYSALSELRKTIEEYRMQQSINSNELMGTVKETAKLAKILTTNQNLKGQFGENCLENILKICFPNENSDYIKQFETQNEDNKTIKPDFLVKLPNEKSILIDCKLNLEKYISYKENIGSKNDFIKDLNTTINNLSNKKYETAQEINQPDFILMYIPLEPIISEIYTDNDYIQVIKNANEKNVIIVGNSSVLTAIRLIKLLWAQEKQNKNILNIINTAETLYQEIAKHSQELTKIKEILNDQTTLFNKEFDKISKENKLFKTAEKLRNYGIQTQDKRTGKKLSEIKINSEFLD